MFIENANLQSPRRHHEVLLRSRAYRGELPTVAGKCLLLCPAPFEAPIGVNCSVFIRFSSLNSGFLLYPDTPSKMQTTAQEAFCLKPIPQNRGKDHTAHNTQQESHHPSRFPTSSRQTGTGNSTSRDKEPEEDEQEGNTNPQQGSTKVTNKDIAQMQSQYQKDYPPPSSIRRRRTPALPQPDNIGINPAFRIKFSTVQREAFCGWPIRNPSSSGGMTAALSRQPKEPSKEQSSTC
ncbi:uncharacterized protein si:dkeyp-69c1.9 isoform X2 [Channa argus]|uniref:uncharacterized protein si:dkeyp-69c1.9 isoform X2 n=1 Tax=Channa argus TaxID=215402 RepID=UPI00351FF017